MYSYQEALDASTEYFAGDELAARVFTDKYALRNNNDEILEKTPDDMHRRLAKEFARIEKNKFKNPLSEDEIFELFRGFKRIVPQGSPMYGIGNPYQYVSYGNCFVIPNPADSYLGIMHTDTQITQISCRRGGVGWDVSDLRPVGVGVRNAAKSTTGVISFMKRFSNTVREIGQSGRRGASLQSLAVNHPEILDFIKVKQDLTQVTGSNISVKFTDDFLKAVEADKDFELKWPVDSDTPKITKLVKAKDIWKEFIHSAWLMAEPGAMYWDTVIRRSTTAPYKKFGYIETSSNPCGEQYLPPYASCRLILINLLTYVKNKFTKKAYFDFELFAQDVKYMQRLGDDMVDLELEAVDRIIKKIKSDPESDEIKKPGLDLWKKVKECAINDRRTGCGFTALADCIAALNMGFDSKQSLEFINKMSEALKVAAFEESVDMAKELGPFPIYDSNLDISSEFVQELRDEHPELYKKMVKYGRRNMTLLTVAPAGSVSCLTQTSSGLEPVFMLEYKRRKKGNPGDKDFRSDFVDQNKDHWMEFIVRHHGLQEWMNITGKTNIEESPYHQSTAHDINWVEKVKMQGIIGKHIDNSLSVTVNLPNDVTEEKVSEIYLTAWKTGCKGMTIYRDGCRTGVLVSNDKKEEKHGLVKTQAPSRPKSLSCDVHHLTVKGIRYFAIIGLMDNEPYEVFIARNCNNEGDSLVSRNITGGKLDKVKRGHYNLISGDEVVYEIVSANCEEHEEMLARMTSTALRHGSDISFVVHQLEKTRGDMQSFSKVIARTLKKYIPDGTEVKGEQCGNCGGKLVRIEGCQSCQSCGWSKC